MLNFKFGVFAWKQNTQSVKNAQEVNFSVIKISLLSVNNPQFPPDLFIFTKEILNGKFRGFLQWKLNFYLVIIFSYTGLEQEY